MAVSEVANTGQATLADLLDELGVAPDRVFLNPAPGSATEQDVTELEAKHNRLCELVNGTLVEKVMWTPESVIAGVIVTFLNTFVLPRKLGIVTVPDGMYRLAAGSVRIPDVAFVSATRFPDGRVPAEAISSFAPDLAIEVLSPSNSEREMTLKVREYFESGVLVVWLVDPRHRTVTVLEAPDAPVVYRDGDLVTVDHVLPEFSLAVSELFDACSLDFGCER